MKMQVDDAETKVNTNHNKADITLKYPAIINYFTSQLHSLVHILALRDHNNLTDMMIAVSKFRVMLYRDNDNKMLDVHYIRGSNSSGSGKVILFKSRIDVCMSIGLNPPPHTLTTTTTIQQHIRKYHTLYSNTIYYYNIYTLYYLRP